MLIRLQKISRSFPRPDGSRVEALRDVDLAIGGGELVAVVGPSGSGKSTLMNVLGLLDRPDSGSYELAGSEVSGLSERQRAAARNRTLGFVFQRFHLLPRTTARENVELPLLYSDRRDVAQRATEALARVGLADRLDHYPAELSGGQQQRVAIARALVNDPQVILADEPTGNLDRESGRQVMDLFEQLNRGGATIVLVTHDAALARRAARVIHLDDGALSGCSAPGSAS